jgi:threonine/homoserine/homoserine lactone efflux protein
MWSYLVMGITMGFAAGVQPGPLSTFLISRALTQGWRKTLPAALAPLISDAPIVALVLLVLRIMPIWLQSLLHFAGGFFILYLAWGTYQSFKKYQFAAGGGGQSGGQSLLKAGLVNLLNPNPYLMWIMVMGPLFLEGWREAPSSGLALIGGFYVTIILTFMAIILLFATLRKTGPGVSRALLAISALVLAAFGLYQIWLGARSVWFSG